MRIHSLKNWFWWGVFTLLPVLSTAQHEDCRDAFIICSDSTFTFLPTGRGINDFANPNNDQSCLLTGENISAWFYFELREDMPLDSNILGFQIIDTIAGFRIDYDFAIYGPDVNCDSLGEPFRCSFGRLQNLGSLRDGDIVRTGTGSTATDTNEDFNGDGFIAPMEVFPGQGFFMVIDFFVLASTDNMGTTFDSTAIQDFKFIWGGTAAPYLNCIVNPNCDQVVVDVGPDQTVCAGDTVNLATLAQNTNGGETYTWTEENGLTRFLDNPGLPNTQVRVPVNFDGTLDYTMTVKEGACVHDDVIRIQVENGGVPQITGDSIVCEGERSTITAEAGFDSYLWSNGQTNPSIRVPGGRTYRVTVTTAGTGCPGVGEFFIRESVAPRPFIEGAPNICPEGRTDTKLVAPPGFKEVRWGNGFVGDTILVFDPGEYTLTVVDDLNCETTDTVFVELLPTPFPAITGDPVLCEGTSSILSVSDTFPTIAWNNIQFTAENTITTPGTYEVEVEDANGCRGRNAFEVTGRANPEPALRGDSLFCSNLSTTLIGPNNFTYNWSTGDTLQTVTIATPGTVALTVTDAFGCEGSVSTRVDTLPVPKPVPTGVDYICEGGQTTIDAGDFVAFEWSIGSSRREITVNTADTFFVVVTATNGCRGQGVFSVSQRLNPVPAIEGDTLLCPGEVSTLSLTQVFPDVSWSTGVTTPATEVSAAGEVTVQVIDEFGCPGTARQQVEVLSAPVPDILGITAFCDGASASLTGEPGFVAYEWPDGSTEIDFTATRSGPVTLMVTDSNGCVGANTINVEERSNPIPEINGDTLFCPGASTVLQGTNGFSLYVWSTGDSTREISAGLVGTVRLQVTDAFGCQGDTEIELDTFTAPKPEILGNDYVCETGTTELSANTFSRYAWSTNVITPTARISAPGIYGLTVTDRNGCQGSTAKEIRLQENPDPVITGDSVLCPGESTTLSLTQSFEEYRWSSGERTPTANTSTLGFTSVSVIDNFGCPGIDSIFLTGVPNPTVSIDGRLDICDGEGSILFASEGFAAYRWSNGSDSISTIAEVDGNYAVTVVDNNGCEGSTSTRLRVNENPKPDIMGRLEFCLPSNGDTVGTTLSVRRIFEEYRWSTGESGREFITVKTPGIYTVTVVSPGNCTNSDTVEVVANIPIPSPIDKAELDICDGETLELDGGPGFQNYQWSTGATTQRITIDRGGNYRLTVVDTNSCLTVANLRVEEQELPTPNIIGPSVFCRGTPVSLLAGGSFRRYEWSNGQTGDIIEISSGGSYTLTVTDNAGCQGSLTVFLEERESPEIEIIGDTKICIGDTTQLSVQGGYEYYVWTDDSNETSITVTEPGTYGVLVLSENGCTSTDEVQVLYREQPLFVIQGRDTICSNESTVLDAGGGFLSYLWSTGDTSRTIEVSGADIYTVSVVDDFGCPGKASKLLQTITAPSIDFAGPGGICPGDTITISVDSSLTNVMWSNGDTNTMTRVFRPGVLRVSVADDQGCMSLDSINLRAFTTPEFNLTGIQTFCEGTFTTLGIDRILPRLEWSTGDTTNSIRVDSSGAFALTAYNADGCPNTKIREVEAIPAPPVITGPDGVLNCYQSAYLLGGDASNYPPEVRLRWTGPGIIPGSDTIAQPEVMVPGVYTLQTTDQRTGCVSRRDTVEVVDLQYIPDAIIASSDTVDCTTGTITLSAGASSLGDEFLYTWKAVSADDDPIAAGELEVEVSVSQDYILEVLDTLTGCNNADTITVQVDPDLPAALIAPFDALNCQRPVQTLVANSAPIGSNWEFRWIYQNDTTTAVLNESQLQVNQAGPVFLLVENTQNGCVDIDTALVVNDDIPPAISAGPDIELDCFQPEIQLGEPFADSTWIINWYKLGAPDFVTAQQRPVIDDPGTYILEVYDPKNGCTSIDTAFITQYSGQPDSVDIQVIPVRCAGERNGQITIQSVSGGEGPYLYQLDDNGFSTQNFLNGLAAKRYLLTIQDARGCELQLPVVVEQGAEPILKLGPDRQISQGEQVRLAALTNIRQEAIQSLRWLRPDTLTCDTCTVQVLRPLKTTPFAAEVIDTNGCRAFDELIVFVDRSKRVFIPNVFSPDGDGNNDYVTVFASPNARRVVSFQIFQRSGDQVFRREDFSPNDLSLGWNGFHKGRIMNNQVFVYYAVVEFLDGEIVSYKGDITLMR